MDKLRLMVVDDHDVVRMGLRALIENQEDLEFIAEASGGQEAVSKRLPPTPMSSSWTCAARRGHPELGEGKALLDPDVTQAVLERLRSSRFDESDPKLRRLNAQEDGVLGQAPRA